MIAIDVVPDTFIELASELDSIDGYGYSLRRWVVDPLRRPQSSFNCEICCKSVSEHVKMGVRCQLLVTVVSALMSFDPFHSSSDFIVMMRRISHMKEQMRVWGGVYVRVDHGAPLYDST